MLPSGLTLKIEVKYLQKLRNALNLLLNVVPEVEVMR
jgi:hypothetical protein